MSTNKVSLVWNGNMFLLTIPEQDYLYSYDGKSWTTLESPPNQPKNIKWTGSQFVTQGNTVSTSIDGIHYTPLRQTSALPPLIDMEVDLEFPHTITFPQNMTMALGGSPSDTTKIAYSLDDGLTWTSSANASDIFTNTANHACWNGKLWVAVGEGNHTLATSADGIHWIGRGSYIFSEAGTCVKWNDSIWLAGGSGTHTFATSYDGVYWTGRTQPYLTQVHDVLWNGSLWVATGIPVSNQSVIYSRDGIIWEASEQTDLFDIQGTRLSWNGRFWTAVGQSQNHYNVATSVDGKKWQVSYSANPVVHVANADSKTWFFDNQSNVLFSQDNTWENALPVLIPGVSTPTAMSVNDSYFLIGGGNAVATSVDGIHWQTATTIANLSTLKQLVWNHPHVGTPRIQPLTIALGEGNNTLGYSPDGLFWKGLGNHIFSVRGNKAVWNGSLWVAVGFGGFWVATSYDGIQWTGRDSSIMGEGLDVAWNGTAFVAVGYGGTHKIATSLDGLTWRGLTQAENLFSAKASAIAWTGNIWLAYGSGGNTTAYSSSPDGSVWQRTPQKNQVLNDASSVSLLPSTMTASSVYSESFAVSNAFDVTQTGAWRSSETYDGNTGESSASGEWIQIAIETPQRVVYYHVTCWQTEGAPKEWMLSGSNDGETWTLLDHVTRDSYIPIQIQNTFDHSASYTYYRFVFPSVLSGTMANVSKIELFYENSQTIMLPTTMHPIVTPRYILYPFSMLSGSYFRVADLSGNVLPKVFLLDGSHNRMITSHCFDGQTHLLTSYDGYVYTLSDTEESIALSATPTNQDTIQTSCFNGRRVVLGGNHLTYNSPWQNGEPACHPSVNGSSLFTQIHGLASNPGYGCVNTYNRLYFKPHDQISVVGPKTYPSTLSQKNILSISLQNVDESFRLTTDVIGIPVTESKILRGPRGPRGRMGLTGPMGPEGPEGPTGPKGDHLWVYADNHLWAEGVAIGSQTVGEGVLSVEGNVHVSENWRATTMQTTTFQTESLTIGKEVGMAELDVSGNVFMSGSMTIGTDAVSEEYALNVEGSVNADSLIVTKTTKKMGSLTIQDSSHVVIDYAEGDDYYMDVGISITESYTGIVNQLPLAEVPDTVYTITLIHDYTHSTNDRYYCKELVIDGQTFEPFFTDGIPSRLSTQFKQTITILCIQSTIQFVYCTITNYSI